MRTGRRVIPGRRIVRAVALALKSNPGALVAYCVLTLAAGLVPVVVAWLSKLLIDALVEGAELRTLIVLSVVLAVVGLVVGLVPAVSQYLQAELERGAGLQALDGLFSAVNRLVGLGRFEDPDFLDRLRLAQQAGGMVAGEVVEGCLGVVRAALTIVGFVSTVFVLNPVMAVFVLLAGAPTLVADVVLSRRRARAMWEIGPIERREFFYGGLLTSTDALKEIKLFGIGEFLRGRMLSDRRSANAVLRSVDRKDLRFQTALGTLAALVSGGGIVWAVSAAREGVLSVGDISVFIMAVSGLQSAMSALAGDLARAHHGLLIFGHHLEVTNARPDLPVAAPGAPVHGLRRGIEFRDVWFRYSDGHPWVLRGFNLYIEHGGSLALVGLNGAGKSTVVKLLCRFYDPVEGAVLWDGVDIRDMDVHELRRRIGAVFQDFVEYDMTAAENIGLGDLSRFGDRRRIEEAARLAGVHDKLSRLPHGYETLLSRLFFAQSGGNGPDVGVVLSGGEWQRLALARAFLRDRPDLMILDEPSAGLDAEAEHAIHTSLRDHRRGRTSLLISHRLGAVRDADAIAVFSNGRITEYGDHATLMSSGGAYARLFRMQAAGYREHAGQDGLGGHRP